LKLEKKLRVEERKRQEKEVEEGHKPDAKPDLQAISATGKVG